MSAARACAWRRLDGPGLEHCTARFGPTGGDARGVMLAREEGAWFAFRWTIAWDARGATRSLRIEDLQDGRILEAVADGAGVWQDLDGDRPDLAGCLDADVGASPFSNTLPIRRLDLAPGQRAEVKVAWAPLPRLEIRPILQRYTCLARTAEGATWLWEDADGGRHEGLRTDADGLVTLYPGLFERVDP